MALGHAERVDGPRDVTARHRPVLAGDGGLLAPRAEQRPEVALARARGIRAHRFLAEVGGVGGDLRPVLGDGGLDLRDLLVHLLQLLFSGVVLLSRGVEALLVGGELRGDLRGLGLSARKGVGASGAQRDAEHAGQHGDDSSSHQNGAPRPPLSAGLTEPSRGSRRRSRWGYCIARAISRWQTRPVAQRMGRAACQGNVDKVTKVVGSAAGAGGRPVALLGHFPLQIDRHRRMLAVLPVDPGKRPTHDLPTGAHLGRRPPGPPPPSGDGARARSHLQQGRPCPY